MALERPWSCMPRIARKHGQNDWSAVNLSSSEWTMAAYLWLALSLDFFSTSAFNASVVTFVRFRAPVRSWSSHGQGLSAAKRR